MRAAAACGDMWRGVADLGTSHTRAVPSREPETSVQPSADIAKLSTPASCPAYRWAVPSDGVPVALGSGERRSRE